MDSPVIIACPACKTRLKVPPGIRPGQAKCPKCGALFSVPAPAAAPPAAPVHTRPVAPPAAPVPAPPAAPVGAAEYVAFHKALGRAHKSGLRIMRWAFLLTIVPLAWYTFAEEREPDYQQMSAAFLARLQERLQSNPELKEQFEKLDQNSLSLPTLVFLGKVFGDAEFCQTVEKIEPGLDSLKPEERQQVLQLLMAAFVREHSGVLPPPFLPSDTWAHWGLGALAAVVFLSYFCFAYPRGNARTAELLALGAFTGTIGIVLLFLLQWLSALALKIRVRGASIITLIWLILFVIGFSYGAADDPDNGFILSFLGFTVGVGLCEELCKAMPLVWHYRTKASLNWGGACLWGLVSGAGFGISEAIMYSSRYYNGSSPFDIYVVRFVSCVAMHAAWAGSTAILIYRRQELVRQAGSFMEYVNALWPALIVPMILHGLYDTLLKMDMSGWALAVGTVSFAFFVALEEREARSEMLQGLKLLSAGRPRAA